MLPTRGPSKAEPAWASVPYEVPSPVWPTDVARGRQLSLTAAAISSPFSGKQPSRKDSVPPSLLTHPVSPLATPLTQCSAGALQRKKQGPHTLAPWPEPSVVGGEGTTRVCHPPEGSVLNVSLEQESCSDLTSAIDLQGTLRKPLCCVTVFFVSVSWHPHGWGAYRVSYKSTWREI